MYLSVIILTKLITYYSQNYASMLGSGQKSSVVCIKLALVLLLNKPLLATCVLNSADFVMRECYYQFCSIIKELIYSGIMKYDASSTSYPSQCKVFKLYNSYTCKTKPNHLMSSWKLISFSMIEYCVLYSRYNCVFSITEMKSATVLLTAVYLMIAGKLVVVCT